MKRLGQVLNIGPKYAEQFDGGGIHTVMDLARSGNLPDLSARTGIPLELVQQWHVLALQKVKASRYTHRAILLIVVVITLALGWEVKTFFRRAPGLPFKGDAFYNQGLYAKALEQYTKDTEKKPNSDVAFANKGAALRMLDRYPEAIVALNKAIALNPRYVWAYKERGAVYSDQRNYEPAITDYDKAIELDPADKFAYALKGSALGMLKRRREAIGFLDKAIELDPRYVWAYTERGNFYSDDGKYETAIADYDQAISLDAKYKFAYGQKALALRGLKRYDKALDALRQAIDIDPEWSWPYTVRASIYHDSLFHYGRAYEDLTKVSELADNDAVEADLAEAALTSGHLQEADSRASKLLADHETADYSHFDVSDRCAARFIVISALLLEGNKAQAKSRLEDFINFYKSAAPAFEREWDYSGTEHYIVNWRMDSASKKIILDLIKLLQPRPQMKIDDIEQAVSNLK